MRGSCIEADSKIKKQIKMGLSKYYRRKEVEINVCNNIRHSMEQYKINFTFI